MKLQLLPGPLAVCQLAPNAVVPAWVVTSQPLVSVTRTAEELSIVCAADLVPAGVKHEAGWRAFKVAGPLDFSLTGILSSLLDPLAKAGISTFCIATYNTDYVLVKDARANEAVKALQAAGHTIRAE